MTLQPPLPAIIVMVVSALYLAIATPLTGGLAAWTEEFGAIESLGFLLMLMAPLVFFLHFPSRRWLPLLHVPVFTLLLAKREAESDWWIIDERLLSLTFYAREGLTVAAFVGGLIALIVLVSVVTFFRYGLPAIWQGLRQGTLWMQILAAGVILAAGGQLLEELAIPLSQSGLTDWTIIFLEESSEMVFSLCVVLAILAVPRHVAATPAAGEAHGRVAPDRIHRPDPLDGAGAPEPAQYQSRGN